MTAKAIASFDRLKSQIFHGYRIWRGFGFALTVLCLPIAIATTRMAYADTGSPELDLAKYKGKVVYVDFWASWCGPCQESFPWMSALAKRMPADDFVLIAVNVDHERDKADAFLRRVGGNVPVVFDPDGALARRFGVKGMPASFIIGRDGKILFSHEGFFAEKEPAYEAHISEALHAR